MITARRMAAASVIFLISLLSLLYWAVRDKNKTGQVLPSVVQAPMHQEEKMAVLQKIVNESSRARTYSLPDGSKLELAGNSQVAFNNPFINGRRDFFLTGEAIFTVIKDKVRPFSVHSKGIVTTALGTVFGVNDKGSLATTVHLYSGRIVIGKEKQDGNSSFKNIYLLPGQELVLNNKDFSVRIGMTAPKAVPSKPEIPSRQPQILQFNKQSLADIFSVLQKECKTTIEYDTAGLKNMDFTGSFDKGKETLESFLSTLCSLNDLNFSKTGANHFSIQKQ
jgi:ferric-dicitrate binding protein FerR (iron transport regulator)